MLCIYVRTLIWLKLGRITYGLVSAILYHRDTIRLDPLQTRHLLHCVIHTAHAARYLQYRVSRDSQYFNPTTQSHECHSVIHCHYLG